MKICGITNREDAVAAVNAGADMLGFVLTSSPRRATYEVLRECDDLPVLKVAVVVLGFGDPLPSEIADLLDSGFLDFVQFHGDESAETVRSWPSYKAINLKNTEDTRCLDITAPDTPGSPAVLVDAFSPEARGGTGKRLDPELVAAASSQRRLWIAGGLNSDNIGGIVAEFSPALVDVSSGIESEKGKKDHTKLRRFIEVAKGKEIRK